MQTGGARLRATLTEANELALYTLPLSASARHMAAIDSAHAPTPQVSRPALRNDTDSSHLCAQEPQGTEPEAVGTVTPPADARASQNDSTPPAEQPEASQQAGTGQPNGAVNASPGEAPAVPAPSTSGQPAQAAAADANASSAGTGSAASTSGANADEAEKAKDAEKDRASMNTSTQTYARSHSTRPKETKSVSELAHTVSTAPEQPARKGKAAKKSKQKGSSTANPKASLFSRLFHVFVPCVGPSSKAHPTELDVEKPLPAPAAAPDAPSAADLREKQTAKETQELPPKPPTPEAPSPADAQGEGVASTSTAVPPPLQPLEVPPPSDDPTVVVPPTPTKSVLPKEEGGGVLSGSVQPIGSTGDDVAHEHRHRDSDRDSDGSTSFTDEEDVEEPSPIDGVEDEEERLIMNGGAGIPIGPVRAFILFLLISRTLTFLVQDGVPRPLLPPLSPKHAGRKCLVLDLDETLVHSSFKVA